MSLLYDIENLLQDTKYNNSVMKILSNLDVEYLVDNNWDKYPNLNKIIMGDILWSEIVSNLEEKLNISLDKYVKLHNNPRHFIFNLVYLRLIFF